MDLENVGAVIRPRSAWEAVDLGFSMVRAWWKPVWAAWLATVAPAWWLVWSLTWLLTGKPWAAFLAVWWLRPLFDRVPLYVVSRRLFGSAPAAREVRHDLPRLWTRHFLAALTLERLDLARSFDLPIWELEGLRGAERKARTTLLQRAGRQNALWLTFACSLLEGFTMLAIFELVSLLTPSSGWSEAAELSDMAAASGEPTAAFWWWMAAIAFLAFTAIEPFYVAAGFSLYLSRRIHLEGWDVELAFRRLAARLTGGEPLRRKAGRTAAMVLVVLALHPGAAESRLRRDPHPLAPSPTRTHTRPGEGEPRVWGSSLWVVAPLSRVAGVRVGEGTGVRVPAKPAPVSAPADAVREVLKEPEFQTRKKMKVWRPKRDWKLPEGDPSAPSVSLPFLQPLVLIVAAALLISLLLVAVKGLIRRRPRPVDDDGPAGRGPLPAAVFGLDIRPESLPEDVAGAAWSAWERGEPDNAMGLLYRAAIAFLVRREGLPVRESWTEGDCVEFVRRKAASGSADYFARLTRAWQSTAYAHRPPSTDEARTLCTAWVRHFGATEEAA